MGKEERKGKGNLRERGNVEERKTMGKEEMWGKEEMLGKEEMFWERRTVRKRGKMGIEKKYSGGKGIMGEDEKCGKRRCGGKGRKNGMTFWR